MNKAYRFGFALILLVGIPINVVQWIKGDLGQILSTPPERQRGDRKAKVLIVEYSDFQCGACAAIEPAVNEILKTYEGRIRFAFKHFPLMRVHKNAFRAAQAAECAAEQQQFWPYHGRLFSAQDTWKDLQDPSDTFAQYAGDLQLNKDRFKQCLDSGASRFLIEADVAEGKSQQVNSTPTFFINGKRVVGRMFASEAAQLIEQELRR